MSTSHKPGFGWPHLLFVLVLLFVLWGLSKPLILHEAQAGSRTEALNNAKAIAGALVAFRNEHGALPCQFTRENLEENGIENLPSGTNANAYLAQLIVTDFMDSETYFFTPEVSGIRVGDDHFESSKELLAPGENGFAYVMAPNEEPLSDTKSITPLVIAPVSLQNGKPTFDPAPFADYYVYGAADGSGKQGKISPDGLAMSKGREHLFQTGEDSLFGDEIPVVKYPLGFEVSPPPLNK